MMSISSKNEHKSIDANISWMTISGCRLNSLNCSKVTFTHLLSWKSCWMTWRASIWVYFPSCDRHSFVFFFYLRLIISFKACLICILNYKTFFHWDWCWWGQHCFLINILFCLSSFQRRNFSSSWSCFSWRFWGVTNTVSFFCWWMSKVTLLFSWSIICFSPSNRIWAIISYFIWRIKETIIIFSLIIANLLKCLLFKIVNK